MQTLSKIIINAVSSAVSSKVNSAINLYVSSYAISVFNRHSTVYSDTRLAVCQMIESLK